MGNSASALPYAIGDQKFKPSPENGGWSIHDGTQKSDGMEVTVFQANKPTLAKTLYDKNYHSKYQIIPAYHHFQNSKKLRHPNILKVHATLDTDYPNADQGAGPSSQEPTDINAMATTGDLIIVTEPCIPLSVWLEEGNSAFFDSSESTGPPSSEQLAWGLQCIIDSLVFLHNSAKLSHGNITPESFFVTKSGDIKLWNFCLITPIGIQDGPGGGPTKHFRDWEQLITPNIYRSPERKDYKWEAVATCAVHCMDSYSLGILIQNCIYSNNQGVPHQLTKAVQRLQTPSLKSRPRLQPLLRCPVFDTPYKNIQLQLGELHIQEPEQKISFWTSLLQLLQSGTIDKNLALYKILPIMKSTIITTTSNDTLLAQDMYRKELLAILNPLFYIGETYLKGEGGDNSLFSKELSPIIQKLFGVNDRGVRGTLLQRTSIFANDLDKTQLNQAVFEPMCSGFTDSSSVLRELTLKSTIVLLPHLTPPNVEKLSRYLVRLQSDTEATIRTNVIIFICKLAPHLTTIARDKMLLPAYIRSMKDIYQPCRLASLQSITKSKDLFTVTDLANKVLPSVMPILLDSSMDVRKEAFIVVNTFLEVLKVEDARLANIEELNPTPPPGAQQQGGMQQGGMSGIPPQGTGMGVQQSSPMMTSRTAPMPPTSGFTPGGLSATKNINTPVQQPQQQQPPAPAPSSGSYMSSLSSWMSSSAQPTTASTPAPPPAAAPAAPPPPQQQQQQQQPAFSSLSLSDAHIGGGGGISNSAGGGGGADNDGWDDVDDDDFGDLDDDIGGGITTTTSKQSDNSNLWGSSSNTTSNNGNDDFFNTFDSSKSIATKPKITTTSKKLGTSGGRLMMPSKSKTPKLTVNKKPEIKKLAADKNDDTDWDDF